jgi:GTP-binding protein
LFLDTCKIYIKAGNGGDGHASFRREKYVARGGPDGGDGGSGGSVIFEADAAMSTLSAFRYKQHFRADNGEKRRRQQQDGKSAEALIIKVPVGTLVKAEDGRVLADMSTAGERKVILRGGRGGRGNARFATPTRQAPKFAQPGEKTTEFGVRLELKTIADVGLIGLPNVGKSTILPRSRRRGPRSPIITSRRLRPTLALLSAMTKRSSWRISQALLKALRKAQGLDMIF